MGFGGNDNMPLVTILSSTTTGFTFEFVDTSSGNAEVPSSGAGTTLPVDFVTSAQSL